MQLSPSSEVHAGCIVAAEARLGLRVSPLAPKALENRVLRRRRGVFAVHLIPRKEVALDRRPQSATKEAGASLGLQPRYLIAFYLPLPALRARRPGQLSLGQYISDATLKIAPVGLLRGKTGRGDSGTPGCGLPTL